MSDRPQVARGILAPDSAHAPNETQAVNCSSGACGGTGKIEAKLDRVARRTDGSYVVTVGSAEVQHGKTLEVELDTPVSGTVQLIASFAPTGFRRTESFPLLLPTPLEAKSTGGVVGYLTDTRKPPDIEGLVRERVQACAGHPALLCYGIGNEVPASVARWVAARSSRRRR